MALDIDGAVRIACLWLPEVQEFASHGSPNFKVRGRTFATYVVNHHGDGRVALWLNVPRGSQETHVRAQPAQFFVPPYMGPSGWLGVLLDQGVTWPRIAALVREAYEKVAPADLRAQIGNVPAFKGPVRALSDQRVDPFKSPRAVALLKRFRAICLRFPETREGSQFGHAAWYAGKKTFAIARPAQSALHLLFWVGVDQQGMMTADPRYTIPPYLGHHGWVALDVSAKCDWGEIEGLAAQSYRHFALRRMLRELGD